MCFECGGCKGSNQIIKFEFWLFPLSLVLELAAHESSGCDHKPSFGARGAFPWSRLMGTDQIQGGLWRTGQMQLKPFHPRIDKRHSFCVFPPEVRRRRLLFRSVSGKRTWKYTESAVIICEGLFTFKGNAEGEKGRQTQDEGLDEGLVCESNRAG